MKRRAFLTGLITVLIGCLFVLAACDNPTGGGEGEGSFTISLGGASGARLATYPPNHPYDPSGSGPTIDEFRFEIWFKPVSGGNGVKHFKFDGDKTMSGSVPVGIYTVNAEVYEVDDTSGNVLYAHGSAVPSPVEIKSGTNGIIRVELYNGQSASAPVIGTQPQDTNYTVGDTTPPLTINATAEDGGTLTYQWYINGTPTNSGGALVTASDGIVASITGGSSFTPSTDTAGTSYFYVVVTNTRNGTTATATSNVVTVTVGATLVPVTSITSVPTAATAGTPLTLTSTVNPSNATNTTITWTVMNVGGTGATIAAGTNILTTTAAGIATVRATITDGTAVGTNYTQDFTITVTAVFVPVTPGGITGVPTTATVGIPLTLISTVNPSNATNTTITWTVTTPGTTGATIAPGTNILNATAAGTATVRATIVDGTAVGMNYTQDFTITVSYGIGGRGPGGGIIFYHDPAGFWVDGFGSLGDPGYFPGYTAYYLEAAPDDLVPPSGGFFQWQWPTSDIATGTTIGTGRRNTLLIATNTTGLVAAGACLALNIGGINDWFLPSQDELREFYIRWVGDFRPAYYNLTNGNYWSSSQYDNFDAYYFLFPVVGTLIPNPPVTYYGSKNGTAHTRAIRAF
ncbi:MAG: hypothetical protein FWH19_06125 [Treponema sp.]|nr:hypothetical protein [Treponema sp.]